jgi:hypothetical protein
MRSPVPLISAFRFLALFLVLILLTKVPSSSPRPTRNNLAYDPRFHKSRGAFHALEKYVSAARAATSNSRLDEPIGEQTAITFPPAPLYGSNPLIPSRLPRPHTKTIQFMTSFRFMKLIGVYSVENYRRQQMLQLVHPQMRRPTRQQMRRPTRRPTRQLWPQHHPPLLPQHHPPLLPQLVRQRHLLPMLLRAPLPPRLLRGGMAITITCPFSM